jgi:hypothetical protein
VLLDPSRKLVQRDPIGTHIVLFSKRPTSVTFCAETVNGSRFQLHLFRKK